MHVTLLKINPRLRCAGLSQPTLGGPGTFAIGLNGNLNCRAARLDWKQHARSRQSDALSTVTKWSPPSALKNFMQFPARTPRTAAPIGESTDRFISALRNSSGQTRILLSVRLLLSIRYVTQLVEACNAARHLVSVAHDGPTDLRHQEPANRMTFSPGIDGQPFKTRVISSCDDDWRQMFAHIHSQ